MSRQSMDERDLAIAEDPEFGQAPFFTAKRLRIGVEMKPLLMNRQVVAAMAIRFGVTRPQFSTTCSTACSRPRWPASNMALSSTRER